jgi:flagellar biogenesis protein FliO
MVLAATALLAPLADVSGTGAASNVSGGAVLTLVLPLALLAIVLVLGWLAVRTGWPSGKPFSDMKPLSACVIGSKPGRMAKGPWRP